MAYSSLGRNGESELVAKHPSLFKPFTEVCCDSDSVDPSVLPEVFFRDSFFVVNIFRKWCAVKVDVIEVREPILLFTSVECYIG